MSEIACNIIGVKKYRPGVQCSYGFNGVDLIPLHLSYTYVKSLSIVSWFNL